jgi:3-oxoacyl-[acyl-carrier-protein] synthase III
METKAKTLFTEAPGTALGKMQFVDHEDVKRARLFSDEWQGGVRKRSPRMCETRGRGFQENNIGFDDIALLLPHQPNLRMIEAIIESAVPSRQDFHQR